MKKRENVFQSIESYNNYIYSTTGARPIDIMEGKEVKNMIQKILNKKMRRIHKLNKNRKNFRNTEQDGYRDRIN